MSDVSERADATPAAPAGPQPIAEAGALGLVTFAVSTFLLSMVNANLVSSVDAAMVLPVAFFVGGIVQLIAGILLFRANNQFGGTVHSLYGGFWMSYVVLAHNVLAPAKGPAPAGAIPATPASLQGHAVGLYLIAWAIPTLLLTIVALKEPKSVTITLALLTVTFVILGIGEAGASTGLVHFGGWLGIVTAVGAFYVSFGLTLNHVWGKNLVPLL
ncbi:MAG: acetate uptake transporter [Solirubrobacterales bacterium]|nr:acetate uptake transporter [Solirubrobacterales bacterium]